MSLIQSKLLLQVLKLKSGPHPCESFAQVVLFSIQRNICLIENIPGGMVFVMLLLVNLAITSPSKFGNQHNLHVLLTQEMITDGSTSQRGTNQKEIFQINTLAWFHRVLVTLAPVTKVNIVTVTFIHVSSNHVLTQITGAIHKTHN